MVHTLRRRLGVALVCMGLVNGVLGFFAPGAGATHVEPDLYDADQHDDPFFHNPSCADVAANEGAGPWVEYKVNSGAVNGVVGDGTLSVTISNAGPNGFTWTSNIGVDVVIVKAGDAANVYVYHPTEATTDSVETPDKQSVSHYTFCYDISPASISVEKTPDAGTVNQGDDISFTIVVTAGGDEDSENVVVTDELPAGFDWSIDAQDGTACEITDGDLNCDIGTMSPTETYSVTVSASTEEAECGTYDNTANVESNNDSDSDDGSVMVENCTTPTPTISIVKTPDDGTVDHGQSISFSIEVTADGDATSENVTITDDLPPGFDWTESEEACEIADGTLMCSLGSMSSGETFSVTVSASTEQADCGLVENTANVSSDNDSDTDNGDVTIENCDTGGDDGDDGDGGSVGGGGIATEEPELGSLTVSKTVVNGVGGETFDFSIDCGGTVQILSLGNGDSVTIDDLGVGTVCTVTEQAPEDTATETWSTTITDSDGDGDGSVAIDGAESVAFTNTRSEVAGEVVERSEPAPAPAPEAARAPAPEVEAAPAEVAAAPAALPRTGLESKHFMLFAGFALLLGGLLLSLGDSVERRLARRTA